MFKPQLDVLITVLNYCYELSEYQDSLTDVESNSVFAGIAIIDNVCELLLYTNTETLEGEMDGVTLVRINLNEHRGNAIKAIDRVIKG